MDEYYATKEYFSPYFAIIASSGMGKSRAVIELGDTWPVTIFCARSTENTGANPLPRRSATIVSLFEEESMQTLENWTRFFCSFLLVVVDRIGLEGDTIRFGDEPWSQWFRRMELTDVSETTKTLFWSEVIACYRDMEKNHVRNVIVHTANLIPHHNNAMVFWNVCKNMKRNRQYFVLALDEAATLFKITKSVMNLNRTPPPGFLVFRRALFDFTQAFPFFPFLVYMLDTNCSVSNFLPTRVVVESARGSVPGKKLLPPFIYFVMELEQDAEFWKRYVSRYDHRRREISSSSSCGGSGTSSLIWDQAALRMVQYHDVDERGVVQGATSISWSFWKCMSLSRPMFAKQLSAVFSASICTRDVPDLFKENVLGLADVFFDRMVQSSLEMTDPCSAHQDLWLVYHNLRAASLLGSRMPIEVVLSMHRQELVRMGLASILSVSEDLSLMDVAYRSEPVLAVAAQKRMLAEEVFVRQVLEPVCNWYFAGHLHLFPGGIGEVGEFLFQVVLLRAVDKTLVAEVPIVPSREDSVGTESRGARAMGGSPERSKEDTARRETGACKCVSIAVVVSIVR